MTSRVAAVVALVFGGGAAALAVSLAVGDFPRGVPVVACAAAAVLVAWHAVVRRGGMRVAGLAVAALLLAASVVLVVVNDRLLEDLLLVGFIMAAVSAARYAFVEHVSPPSAPRPQRPVMFWNPRSGGGKAVRFNLADEARARGIEPIELRPGVDLVELVNDAVAGGADALAVAGGDGTQAVVARIAAERGLPYACIPAGTRNHFALDLGVDRDDVVGALDAFVDGGERRVDLAEVNGRVFVNNVSLGLYADAVQRPGYRDAKLRTILSTFPDTLGADGRDGLDLHWPGPDGREESAASAILVSNNAYRLGRAIGSGTRPKVDAGVLGVVVLDAPGTHPGPRPWRAWTTRRFEVASGHPVNAGIDGEAAVLEPPLKFGVHPRALRVRIARKHPGASPSAAAPDSLWDGVLGLVRIAAGGDAHTGRLPAA